MFKKLRSRRDPQRGAPAESFSGLARFAPFADRIAVIDTETTGLYAKDRVVEIAVVTLDLHGNVVDEWDTLINPQRDVGPTWIHGITATMVRTAPTFDEVASDVAARLNGAIIAAHNLPFDTRMLRREFEAHNVDVTFGTGLDTLAVTRCKLGVACESHGVPLEGAHQALTDARATAALLLRIESSFDSVQCAAVNSAMATGARSTRQPRDPSTQSAAAPPSYLAELASRLNHTASSSASAAMAQYLDLLDRAMADLHLDGDERRELEALADELGLDRADTRQAHAAWIRDLTDAAATDGIVDATEYDELLRAAHVLGIDPASIHRRTQVERSGTIALTLDPGMSVCFTGVVVDHAGHEIERDQLIRHAQTLGLTVEDRFTKSRCDALVAADVATSSSKAVNARRWGLPIIAAADLLAAEPGSMIQATAIVVGGSTAHTCARCGQAFTTNRPRKSKQPLCPSCR